ncbi:hypothetical protein [Actinoplanes sp. NPDC020271]|uniref:hypothetical protein n=1 Tax=Actinoplanes sp. NPDC020271 TaxID=3363896 RepID=UPI0037A76008
MKVLKVLGGLVAVALVILAGGVAWLLYRLGTDDPAWNAVDTTAATVARQVDLAVADVSPGEYSRAGIRALATAIEARGGSVRHAGTDDSADLRNLHASADVELRGGADGQQDETVCVRFELRWADDGQSTTYHRIDCS